MSHLLTSSGDTKALFHTQYIYLIIGHSWEYSCVYGLLASNNTQVLYLLVSMIYAVSIGAGQCVKSSFMTWKCLFRQESHDFITKSLNYFPYQR